MIDKKNSICIVILLLMMTACVSLPSSNYKRMTETDRSHVKVCNSVIDSLEADGNVYEITATQLEYFVKKHDKVIVYEYADYCKSENCVNPKVFIDSAKNHGYIPIVLAEKFDTALDIPTDRYPVLLPRHNLYKTNIKSANTAKLLDVVTHTSLKQRGWGRYLIFEGGAFKECIEDIKHL